MKNLFLIKISLRKAYSMIEASLIILIVGILFAGAYQGFNVYNETHIASARTLSQNSIVGRLQNMAFWYETTFENSFQNGEGYDGKTVSVWLDHNNQQLTKSNAYSAQRSDSTKFNYEANNITVASGPTFVSNGINGLPSLNFKNTNSSSKFFVVDPSLKYGKDDITIFVVARFKNFENNAVIFDRVCLKNSGSATVDDVLAINSCKPEFSGKINTLGILNLAIQNNDGSVSKATQDIFSPLKKDVPYILTFERLYNKSISLYFNGKLKSTIDENLKDIDFLPIKIGRNAKDQNANSEFDLSEMIMVYGILKPQHKIDVENYLAKKYSIKLER
jgi:Tfp pilus assembly protein PilE